MARINILLLPTEILCEITSYLHADSKDYVFYKLPNVKWTMYIEGAAIYTIFDPITSGQTVLLVKFVAAMTRLHPCSWAVLQPRINEILDRVGKFRRRIGQEGTGSRRLVSMGGERFGWMTRGNRVHWRTSLE